MFDLIVLDCSISSSNTSVITSLLAMIKLLLKSLWLSSFIGENGAWVSGFFDRGSFDEIMQPWAQTVVVGRAR